jgi:hypothetical protein
MAAFHPHLQIPSSLEAANQESLTIPFPFFSSPLDFLFTLPNLEHTGSENMDVAFEEIFDEKAFDLSMIQRRTSRTELRPFLKSSSIHTSFSNPLNFLQPGDCDPSGHHVQPHMRSANHRHR